MQVMRTIVAMQANRHDELHAISTIATHPCKKRKSEAPIVPLWEVKNLARKVGHPPMIFLLRFSGLSIRDAVCLERSALGSDDRLLLRRIKTGVPVMLPLQANVASMLRSLPSDNPRYFWWSGNGSPKSAVADMQRSLRGVFKLADLKHPDGTPKRAHPHMFRHTFSVEMLKAGVALEDVAKLLGHSSTKTTERYYSQWVEARAARLEDVVRGTWGRAEATPARR